MLLTSSYTEARQWVQDGDILILRSPWWHSPLAAATQWLLRTPYTHTGTLLWVGPGVFVAEMTHGRLRLNPLSDYKATPWDVFDCPVDRVMVRDALLEHVRDGVNYDWPDLLRILRHRLTGWPLPKQDDARMICSAFSAHVMLEHCDWRPIGLPTIAAPSDLAAVLKPVKLAYAPEA